MIQPKPLNVTRWTVNALSQSYSITGTFEWACEPKIDTLTGNVNGAFFRLTYQSHQNGGLLMDYQAEHPFAFAGDVSALREEDVQKMVNTAWAAYETEYRSRVRTMTPLSTRKPTPQEMHQIWLQIRSVRPL